MQDQPMKTEEPLSTRNSAAATALKLSNPKTEIRSLETYRPRAGKRQVCFDDEHLERLALFTMLTSESAQNCASAGDLEKGREEVKALQQKLDDLTAQKSVKLEELEEVAKARADQAEQVATATAKDGEDEEAKRRAESERESDETKAIKLMKSKQERRIDFRCI